MPHPIAFSILSLQIGKELVRIIKEECATELALRVVRVGAIEAKVTPEDLAKVFPAVFVIPPGPDYTPNNLQETRFDVVDAFRIAYAVPLRGNQDPLQTAVDGLQKIAAALAKDGGLAELANQVGDNQIVSSRPAGCDFQPEEDTLQDQQVKVVVLRWNVRWGTC